jgi:hypothetical protein
LDDSLVANDLMIILHAKARRSLKQAQRVRLEFRAKTHGSGVGLLQIFFTFSLTRRFIVVPYTVGITSP